MVTLLIYVGYIGERQVAKILVTISRFDSNQAFNRINNRKLTMRLWLMNKMFAIIMIPTKWLIFPFPLLYCAISVHLEEPARYNLVTLAINSIIQLACLVNTIGRLTNIRQFKKQFFNITIMYFKQCSLLYYQTLYKLTIS